MPRAKGKRSISGCTTCREIRREDGAAKGRLVLILFVPIWRSFSQEPIIMFSWCMRSPTPIYICTWPLSCRISSLLPLNTQCVLKTIPRVRPVCLQRGAGGLSQSPMLPSCETSENWLRLLLTHCISLLLFFSFCINIYLHIVFLTRLSHS